MSAAEDLAGQPVDLPRVRAALARLDAAAARLDGRGRERLRRFAADLTDRGPAALTPPGEWMAPKYTTDHPPTTPMTVRTAPEIVAALEALVGELAATPYAATGPLSRSKVADLALRRGVEALRAEAAGVAAAPSATAPAGVAAAPSATAPAGVLAALPSAEVVERARAALEALARLPVDRLEALADGACTPVHGDVHKSAPAADGRRAPPGRRVIPRPGDPPLPPPPPPERRGPDRLTDEDAAAGVWVREGSTLRRARHRLARLGAGVGEYRCGDSGDLRELRRADDGRKCVRCAVGDDETEGGEAP